MSQPKGKAHSQYKHGMGNRNAHPLYKKWNGIKRRCLNPKDKSYSRYGGAGVSVSDSWLEFVNFYTDMHGTWWEGATIDRIDNSKGYSKENCRWVSSAQQARNKSSVVLYEHSGSKYSIPELATMHGLKPKTLYARLKIYGWTLERALTTKTLEAKQ